MCPRCHGIQGPATRTAARVCGGFIRKMRHCGEPHPFALNADQVKGPLWEPDQSPVLWAGFHSILKPHLTSPQDNMMLAIPSCVTYTWKPFISKPPSTPLGGSFRRSYCCCAAKSRLQKPRGSCVVVEGIEIFDISGSVLERLGRADYMHLENTKGGGDESGRNEAEGHRPFQ
jgi:hypothetical protein